MTNVIKIKIWVNKNKQYVLMNEINLILFFCLSDKKLENTLLNQHDKTF